MKLKIWYKFDHIERVSYYEYLKITKIKLDYRDNNENIVINMLRVLLCKENKI